MLSPRAILGSAIYSGLTWLSRRQLPQTSGTLELPGLQAPAEVIRDHWGVPHIYSDSTPDLMFAQGYVHAQDRLWQMDFQRRLACGRLSEVLGRATVAVDRWLRTIGMRPVVEVEAAALTGDVGRNFQAYAAGVNAFIARGPLPPEFILLRYRPEPWVPADTLSWTKMVSWNLSVNWESEILRAQLIERLGPEKAAELEPGCDGRWARILPDNASYRTIGRAAQELVAEARPILGPPAQEGLGSNAWAIAGVRTASGSPLVANDLHQLMGTPSIWYENHLEGGDLHVAGAGLPGVLGILTGHNDHVAWAFSNGFPDVQDLYVEHLRRNDDGRVQYEYQGEWLEARVRRETIRVRGERPVVEEVICTRHGPIINCLAPQAAGEEPLAVRWTSLEPETMAEAFHRLNRARSCQEFHEALRSWTCPAQSIAYADTAGNVGYAYPGRLPIRTKGNGAVPVPGWTGEYEWAGYVPFEELPHAMNPAQGYVACANNRVAGDGYPYHIGSDFCSSDRANRICELVEAQPELDVDYVRRMQSDLVSPAARAVAGYVGQLQTEDAQLAEVVRLMRDWDGELSADSPAATVHETMMPRLMGLILADKLGELAPHYMGLGPNPVLADGSLLGFRAWEWLQTVLAEPRSHWFDLGHGETRDEVIALALRQTADQLRAEMGPEIADWAWGKLHRLTYAHRMSRVLALSRFFNRGPFPIGGDYTTVCATGATQHPEENGEALIGPNCRFIIDLGDLRNSWSQLVPGQAGQPASPHYDDQVQAWFGGEYHRMLYAREDVEREAEARLQLRPVARQLLQR